MTNTGDLKKCEADFPMQLIGGVSFPFLISAAEVKADKTHLYPMTQLNPDDFELREKIGFEVMLQAKKTVGADRTGYTYPQYKGRIVGFDATGYGKINPAAAVSVLHVYVPELHGIVRIGGSSVPW